MWPWGHLAVGYLLYTVLVHLRVRHAPGDRAALALAFGTQFPDLVDKPLAWYVGLLPNGRSLTHSLITAVAIIFVLQALLRLIDRGPVANAFTLGYLTHLAGDAAEAFLAGDYHSLGFLLWPVVPPIDYVTEPTLTAHFAKLSEISSAMMMEIGLSLFVVLVWLLDGAPGLGVVWAVPRWVGRKLTA